MDNKINELKKNLPKESCSFCRHLSLDGPDENLRQNRGMQQRFLPFGQGEHYGAFRAKRGGKKHADEGDNGLFAV